MTIWTIVLFISIIGYFVCRLFERNAITIEKNFSYRLFGSLSILFLMLWFISISYNSSVERNSKHYTYKQTIEQSFKDGKLVKSDTLFVISPKK